MKIFAAVLLALHIAEFIVIVSAPFIEGATQDKNYKSLAAILISLTAIGIPIFLIMYLV